MSFISTNPILALAAIINLAGTATNKTLFGEADAC
jgi:hypothetical protein